MLNSIETEIKAITPTAIRHKLTILKLFDVSYNNFEWLVEIVSKIAENSLKSNEKIKICNIGFITTKIITSNPATPTEFFIMLELNKIKPTPSDKYEPRIGI